MPVLWPCGYKAAPVVYPPLPAAYIVTPPVLSLHFPFGCVDDQPAVLQLDQMPVMNREPETIPNVAGNLSSGYLEYLDMGVSPANAINPRWIGHGAESWDVYVDGDVLGTINAFDGQTGPLSTSLFPTPVGGWDVGPYSVQLVATYHDRPEFRDFYMSAGQGIIAFAPSTDPACPSIGTIGWNALGYYDPWVASHADVTDLLGPVDRYGDYLTLTGPWGSNIGQQHLASAPGCETCHTIGIPQGSAWASTLLDYVSTETYAEITYEISTVPQIIAGCTPAPTATPVFDTTRAHKLGGE